MAAPVYTDHLITATELNRHAGQVLDEARQHPVTITRNDEAFALLPRKDVSRLVEAATYGEQMVNLLSAIWTYRLTGKKIPVGHAFEWVNAFDLEDVDTLQTELHGIFRYATSGVVAWDEFEATLHEWQESALAVRSEALDAAFNAPAAEVPLTRPEAPVE